MMLGAVYLLCAATSLACALLLWRGFRRDGVRLLFWSSLCFFGLTMDNLAVYLDLIVFPEIEMDAFRRLPALLATSLLVFGLIWENK